MEFFTKLTAWAKRNFAWIIAFIFAVKLGLLFWSAHPFDFSAFVGVLERHSIYNWNVFEYWNKGNFLIAMWYPFYALYLLILQLFHLPIDQILLLHFFFKFPFWIADIISMVLVMALTFFFTQSEGKSKWAGLFWAINPIVFGIYGVHGHYEIIVAVSLLLLFCALVWEMPVLFGFAFALAFSTKYFIIILAPLFFFYFLQKKKYQFMLRALVSAVFFTVVFYIQFINHPELIPQTIDSIRTLSQAYVSAPNAVVTIGNLNIFSVTRYFIGQGSITNTGTPGWFAITAVSYYLIAGFCILMYLRQLYLLFVRKIKYTHIVLFQEAFMLLVGFVVLLTNFQWHYMIWFLPFLVILAVMEEFYAVVLGGITIFGFLLFFRNEYGPRTFFLDLFDSAKMWTTSSVAQNLAEALSVIVVFIFVAIVLYIWFKRARPQKTSRGSLRVVVVTAMIAWILLIGTYSQAIWQYAHQQTHTTVLAFRRPNTARGTIGDSYASKASPNTPGEVVFEKKALGKALIIEGLMPYILDGDTALFQAYILFPKEMHLPENGSFTFNEGCQGYYDQGKIITKKNNEKYFGVPIPVTCIGSENKLVFDRSIYLFGQMPTPQLYVTTVETTNLYNPKHETLVVVLGAIGVVGCLVGLLLLGWLIRLLRKMSYEKLPEE